MVAPSVVLVSVVTFLFFLCTYTAWDKGGRRLSMDCLLDVVLLRRGVEHSLVELNKVLALTGAAVLPMAYFFDNPMSHVNFVLWSQLVHAAYSTYKYYGDKIPYLSGYNKIVSELLDDRSKKRRLIGIKRLSVVFGVASLGMLGNQVFVEGWAVTAVSIAVLVAMLVHFIAMELDFKLVLQVRTTGNWVIPMTILSIGYLSMWGGSNTMFSHSVT